MNTFGLNAAVAAHDGAPTLLVEGEPVAPMWYTGWPKRVGYIEDLGRAGLRVFFVPHELEWRTPGAFAHLQEDAERILSAVPNAYLILRTSLYPPREWLDQHPEELIQFADGTPMPTWLGEDCIQALCSATWRQDQTAALEQFLSALRGAPFAKRVIGFFLAAGGTGEWYIPGNTVHSNDQCIGHSPAFREAFSASLRETYTDDQLKAAWHSESASFDQPRIPTAQDHYILSADDVLHAEFAHNGSLPAWPRDATTFGSFLNVATHRHVADYYRALNAGTADSILHFAEAIKERTGHTKVVGAFYGSFASPYIGTASGVTRILNAGCVDFLAAPGNYENRWPGGVTAQREMQDAFRLRNRIFVVEEDTRTCLMGPNTDWGVNSIHQSVEVMKRDFGRDLSEDLYAWWFDMASRGGWYDHPKLNSLIKRQQEVAEKHYRSARTPSPEMALIYDQDSLHYTATGTTADIGHRTRNWEIHRIGAPVAYHYVEDLALPNFPEYKLLVFLNAFAVTEAKRALIRKSLRARSCSTLWIYAPGLINPDRVDNPLSVEHLADLTGFQAVCEQACALGDCKLTDAGAAHLPGLRRDLTYGWFDRTSVGTIVAIQPQGQADCTLLAPYLYGSDPDAEVLMRFSTDDRPAMLRKSVDGSPAILAFFKALSASIYREVARAASCHIYSNSDDILYAGNRFLTLHACTSGEKRIQLPFPSSPYEIYERRSYGESTTTLRCALKTGETRTFHLRGEI